MKKILILSLITLAFSQSVFSQCDPDALSNGCISKLAPGFNFLKTYKITGEQDLIKVEYSYVFAKGTQYMITLCDQTDENKSILVTIYDSQRNKVATNKVNGTLLSGIAYPCNATGIYYLQYTFENSNSRCGGSALGFKRLP